MLLLVSACTEPNGSPDPGDDDDDSIGGDGDADGDADEELGPLPCSARTVRNDQLVRVRELSYDGEGRVSIERTSDDFPNDGQVDEVRLEVHAYGDHGVDTVTHDQGADCLAEYAFTYDHRGRPLDESMAYTFDERGNPLTAVGEHRDCTYEYDEHDNLVLEDCAVEYQQDDGDGTWYPAQETTIWTWIYDADGHETSLDRAKDDYGAEHWRWTWEGGLRVREESWQDNRTADPEVVEWTYDDEGRLETEVRSEDEDRDSVTTFSYECGAESLACVSFRESLETYVAVSLGDAHGCALRADGSLACWGFTTVGPPEGEFTAVGSALFKSCALRAGDGGIECFALNPDADESPWAPPEGPFVALSVGVDHGCALAEDGTIACWGSEDPDILEPPPGSYSAVTVGRRTTCALDDDDLPVCWGGNDLFGEADAPRDEPLRQFDVGYRHGCGVGASGALVCWGDAPETEDGQYTAVAVGGEEQATTCALRDDGTLACWGELTAPEGRFLAVDLADRAACAVREDARLVCWGDNERNATSPP